MTLADYQRDDESSEAGSSFGGTDEISSVAAGRWSGRRLDPRLRRVIAVIVIAAAVPLTGPGFLPTFSAAPVHPEASSPASARPSERSSTDGHAALPRLSHGDLADRSSVIPLISGRLRRVPSLSG